MVDSDDLYGPMEVDDDLSTALGAETLADRDMVPPGFDNTPGSSADTLPIEIFEHRRFLRVERSATLRPGLYGLLGPLVLSIYQPEEKRSTFDLPCCMRPPCCLRPTCCLK